MIREVNIPILEDENSEVSIRIAGLAFAYGHNISEQSKSFLRFYECADYDSAQKGIIAIFSSSAIVVPSQNEKIDEEIMIFLNMNTEIRKIRTTKNFGEKMRLYHGVNWSLDTGVVMSAGADLKEPRNVPVRLAPRDSYPLLRDVFGESMPSFDHWYVDICHRIRHNSCTIVGFKDDRADFSKQPAKTLATAMTVAESEKSALIGAVATYEDARGKGFGSSSVLFLARELMTQGKRVLISPKNEGAFELYKKIGFVTCGYWGELHRL